MTTIYLYIKTHHVKTSKGLILKYFGKTSKDPLKYLGSGTRWVSHLNKYGNEMDTEIYGEFDLETQKYLLKETALRFSADNDIVESKEWANLVAEDGLNGGMPVEFLSEETRANISAAMKGNTNMGGKTLSADTRAKISAAGKGRIVSAETREKISMASTNCTAETRKKLSDNAKGHYVSQETKDKIAASVIAYNKKMGLPKSCDECPECGTLKPPRNSYCSVQCSGKASRKVDWDNIDLSALLEHDSLAAVARMLSVTPAAVRKRKKKLKTQISAENK